jgi:hypothetical protein
MTRGKRNSTGIASWPKAERPRERLLAGERLSETELLAIILRVGQGTFKAGKMYIERTGKWGTFTTDYLDKRNAVRLPTDKPVHQQLFDQTTQHYEADEIFAKGDKLDISEETFRRLVKELTSFNLSATGDDVKGLAFERFLGDTFRGELGQFFTPRPIVDFMVDLLNPHEGELVCDPGAGPGGFLIRCPRCWLHIAGSRRGLPKAPRRKISRCFPIRSRVDGVVSE